MLLLLVTLCTMLLNGPTVVSPAGPLTSISEAIAQAQPGDTIEVQGGVYNEHLVIDKPLTLVGRDRPVIDGGGTGIVVDIDAPDVTLRGFVVRNSGKILEKEDGGIETRGERTLIEDNILEEVLFGIYLNQSPNSTIRNNQVSGYDLPPALRGDLIRFWYSHDSVMEGNTIEGGRDAVIWFSEGAQIRNNVIRNGRYGLHFMFDDDNVLEGNYLEGNSVGAYLMNSKNLKVLGNTFASNRGPSGYGLGLKDMDGILAENNRFVSNRVAVYLDNPPAASGVHDHFQRNLFAYNDIGILFLPLVKNTGFWDNTFWENSEQVAIQGGGELKGNQWEIDGRGNYWSDYAGYDADGDGVGDLPYQSVSLFENLMGRYPALRLFQLSPAADAIDLAARAFPITQPRAKMADLHPLMAPVPLPPGPGMPEPARLPAFLVTLALLAIAVTILAFGQSRLRQRSTSSQSTQRQVWA